MIWFLSFEMEVYRQKTTCLIHFQITSLSKKHLPHLTVNTSNLEEIMSRAYDSFDVQLSNLQLLYSKPGIFTDAKNCKYYTQYQSVFTTLLTSVFIFK